MTATARPGLLDRARSAGATSATHTPLPANRYSVYLLYWYKVQILTQKALARAWGVAEDELRRNDLAMSHTSSTSPPAPPISPLARAPAHRLKLLVFAAFSYEAFSY